MTQVSSQKAPPIKMQGIKTRLLPFIRENIAWDGEGAWIEPFLGSGAVLLNVRPKRAFAADTNTHVIRFYKGVQNGKITAESVRRHLVKEGNRLELAGEEHYYRVRERFNRIGDSHDFLFLNRSCFNGLMRFGRKGNFNTPFCRKPDRYRPALITKIANQVRWAAEAMEGRDWRFVCTDWKATLSHAECGSFVYADPPYEGRHSDFFNNWEADDALLLEETLKGLPCKFLYSMWSANRHRKNIRLHESFSGYTIKTHRHFYHLGATESLRGSMTEALVCN